jgi:hypothetical protein
VSTPSSFVLVLSKDRDDDDDDTVEALAKELQGVTYLKPVRASHLLLRDNCLRHHTDR